MILFSLSVCVFIGRPPVGILLFHHLPFCCSFLLSALVLHPLIAMTEKGLVMYSYATWFHACLSKEETSLLVAFVFLSRPSTSSNGGRVCIIFYGADESLFQERIEANTIALL